MNEIDTMELSYMLKLSDKMNKKKDSNKKTDYNTNEVVDIDDFWKTI